MKKKQVVSFIAGILGVVCYLAFALIAYGRYPLPYSPTRNWLSDLGNVEINLRGAIFYNIGITTTALFLIIFFLGLSRWRLEGKGIQIIMLLLAQCFGILGALCMIMSAIFPINELEMHRIWSMALYFSLATAFVFLAAALRYHPRVPMWLFIMGISTAVLVNLTIFLPAACLLEWITVSLFLGYVGLVGVQTRRHAES